MNIQEIYKKIAGAIIFLVILFLFLGLPVIIINHLDGSYNNSKTTKVNSVSNPAITPNDIINDVANIRLHDGYTTKESYYFLEENYKLDNAATARAKYMAANNVLDNTSGNPWSFVENAGYKYTQIYLASTWGETSSQAVAKALASESTDFTNYKYYTDMGVGSAHTTMNGADVQIFVAYVGSQTGYGDGNNSNYQSSAQTSCTLISSSGNCYEPGEYCSNSDHGVSGLAGNGEAIQCQYNNGWRWEQVACYSYQAADGSTDTLCPNTGTN